MKSKSSKSQPTKSPSFLQRIHISPMAIILSGVLATIFGYICYLNLSLTPSFYCTDMYSDILYAVKAWESKSLFPEGWVFGNQLYVIATPVLASLIYGIVGRPALAMAIATILLTLGIFASYLWMMKPVFPKLEDRLIGLIAFIALTACCGDAIYKIKGWQLFFTLCSYYACYLITAFLCFGCFLRRREKPTVPLLILFGLSVVLSFGAGMQSLRQTAVMLVPMLALEGIQQLICLIRTKKVEWQPLIVTGSIAAANLLGLVTVKLLNVPRNEIFSSTELLEKADIPDAVNKSLTTLMSLLSDKEHYGYLFLIAVAILILAIVQSKFRREEPPAGWGTLISLFTLSVLGILAIDMFTKMSVRNIYYFMMLPLVGLLPVYAYRRWRFGKILALVLLAMLVVGSFKTAILPATETAKKADTNASYAISEMLVEKGYTTIYSGWNQCEDIAIASDGKITAGFWNSSKDVFRPVMYLCDPSIYEVDSDKCVYYLRKDNKDIALKKAADKGVTMTLVAEYPQWGIWLYEASENLMTPDSK